MATLLTQATQHQPRLYHVLIGVSSGDLKNLKWWLLILRILFNFSPIEECEIAKWWPIQQYSIGDLLLTA